MIEKSGNTNGYLYSCAETIQNYTIHFIVYEQNNIVLAVYYQYDYIISNEIITKY